MQFDNLPLIEAKCTLRFDREIRMEYALCTSVVEAVGDSLSKVVRFISGFPVESPLAVLIGPSPGVEVTDGKGVSLVVSPQELAVQWRRMAPDAEYVRFPALFDLLGKAVNAIGNPNVSVVTMSYVNKPPRHEGGPKELMIESVWPRVQGVIRDYNVAWMLDDKTEFRLQVQTLEDATLVATAAGNLVAPNSTWDEELLDVHGKLQQQFLELLTEEARKIWQLRQ
ncbi:MAG: hypothetical protein D6724_06415 [Armatimonadetes bacterium]|nr:MAG: hypothetical protein D6724_06415 [Armatimonadota bacterium]